MYGVYYSVALLTIREIKDKHKNNIETNIETNKKK